MDLVLATNHLGLGGSESYLITVAEQLDRLGHEVVVYTPEPGAGAGIARQRGVAVVEDQGGLPRACDAAVVQDGAVAHELAERFPRTPQLFVAHTEIFNVQMPPQLPDLVGAVVALNERVAARMRSFAVETKIARLRQPIDTDYFAPRGALPAVARHALLLSNNPQDDRLRMIESACATVGLELRRLGGTSGQRGDIRPQLVEADIVIGYGRSILEAMACGRAAYVYDWSGGDGWVTAASYAEIEADGLAGRSGRSTPDESALADDLRRYDASMGPVNHDLVMAHHRANVHAQELVELITGLAEPARRPRAPMQEMARLVRLEWRARFEVGALLHDNARLREQLREKDAIYAQVEQRLAAVYENSFSWRLTAPLRALGRLLRRR